MTAATASARKSLGEYKPLIVHPSGRTEVCEQSRERTDTYTRHGVIPGNRYARGNTYKTREEAIAAAQYVIDFRRDKARADLVKWEAWLASGNHPDGLANSIEKKKLEIAHWGG